MGHGSGPLLPWVFRSHGRQPAGRLHSSKGRAPKTREIRFRTAALLNRTSRVLDRASGTTVRPPQLLGYRVASRSKTFISIESIRRVKPRRSRRAVGAASLLIESAERTLVFVPPIQSTGGGGPTDTDSAANLDCDDPCQSHQSMIIRVPLRWRDGICIYLCDLWAALVVMPLRPFRPCGSIHRRESILEPLHDLAPVVALGQGEADPAGGSVILTGPETDAVLFGEALAPRH